MRAIGSVLRGRGNITLVFGIGTRGVLAPRLLRRPMTTADFEFYVGHILGPCFRRGHVVVSDRLPAHCSTAAAKAIERHKARIELPLYSPDPSPVENRGSSVKSALRKAAARCWDALVDAVAVATRSVTPNDIYG